MRYVLFTAVLLILVSCNKRDISDDSRSFKMGFQNSAPRFDDLQLFVQSLNLWTTRADAAIISTEVPWKELLAGSNAASYVNDHYKDLASFYRNKNLVLWVYIDPQNGLERSSDATALVGAGKSIAQTDIQQKYREFVLAMDSILKPEHLGLALETNLIRLASNPSIYNGVKQAANDVSKELKLRKSTARLSISIQVETAWGKLGGTPFQGIDQDLQDFSFIDEIGFSSYPYLVFDRPSQIPADYYSRLSATANLPVFISEGGWSSASVTTPTISFVSSNEVQKEYIKRHYQLLQSVNATALFQLAFTDIDITSVPPPVPATLKYFTSLGLLDTNMQPKPALNTWDEIFKKRLSK